VWKSVGDLAIQSKKKAPYYYGAIIFSVVF